MVPRILLTTQKMMIPVPVGRSQQVLDGHKVPTVGSDASDAAATPVSVDSFPFTIRLFFSSLFALPTWFDTIKIWFRPGVPLVEVLARLSADDDAEIRQKFRAQSFRLHLHFPWTPVDHKYLTAALFDNFFFFFLRIFPGFSMKTTIAMNSVNTR